MILLMEISATAQLFFNDIDAQRHTGGGDNGCEISL